MISRELLKLHNAFATISYFLMLKFHFIVIALERTEHDTFLVDGFSPSLDLVQSK